MALRRRNAAAKGRAVENTHIQGVAWGGGGKREEHCLRSETLSKEMSEERR